MPTTHVEKSHSDLDADLTVFVMECGASCVADQFGNLTPPDFDFYTRLWSWKATCIDCHRAIGGDLAVARAARTQATGAATR